MKVFITTLGRVNNQVTLKMVPEAVLVVQHQEEAVHRSRFPSSQILVLPRSIDNLGATRRYLLGKFRKEKVILLDDDLVFYVRPTPNRVNQIKLHRPADLIEMFRWVSDALNTHAHVSISAKGNNHSTTNEVAYNQRYMRFLAYRPSLFPIGIEVGRVNGMSDFDLNLQLLRAGKSSCINYKWSQDHKGTQTPGGCALNRTQQSHEEEINLLKGWHDEFVKIVDKENKTGSGFGKKRKEVVIQWAKAYESSKQ